MGRQRNKHSLLADTESGEAFSASARQFASIASLVESSIDILLWSFPLKSHSADAGLSSALPSSRAPHPHSRPIRVDDPARDNATIAATS